MSNERSENLGPENIISVEEARLSLCYFAASGAKEYADEFIEHLTVHSLAKLQAGSRSVGKIREKLIETTGINFEYGEVLSALERLESKKTVYRPPQEDRDESDRFGLTPDAMREFRKQVDDQKNFEQKVVDDWLAEIRSRYPLISDNGLEMIKDDLFTFSRYLYSLHSAESVSMFFGDEDNITAILQQFDALKLQDILPNRPKEIHDIRMMALPKFFQTDSLDRKKYIADHLNPIFALQMMRLNPRSAKVVAEQHIEGGKLFLDTNILYRLFGLGGADLQFATKSVISLSQGLGFEPVVSPRTVQEYNFSIRTRQRNARSVPPISVEVAKAALEVTSTKSINRYLWEKSIDARGRLSPEEYFSLFTNIEALLKQFGITVDGSRHKYITSNDQALADEERRLVETLEWQNTSYEPDIIEHDAYHRLLILDLRQGYEGKTALQTSHWFLTSDSKLPVYDRRARQWHKHKQPLRIPFCANISQWTQMLVPYRGAVDGFDITQVEQLDSPLFRLFRSPDPELVQNVITRMTTIDRFEPDTIVTLIKDEGFLREFSQAGDDEERKEIYENYLSETFRQLKRDKEEVEKRVKELSESVDGLREKYEFQEVEFSDLAEQKKYADEMVSLAFEEVRELRAKLSEYENIASTRKPNQTEVDELGNKVKELQEELNRVGPEPSISTVDSPSMSSHDLSDENRRLKEELEKAKQQYIQNIRYIIALILFSIGFIALSIFIIDPNSLPWLRDHTRQLGLLLSFVGIWLCMCLIVAHNRFRTWGTGGLIIALLSVLPQIIDNTQ